MRVVLADYGAGNLRSVCSALERAGASPVVSANAADVLAAPLVVVAGVGHVAAVHRGAVAGFQFHPERSGPAGARALANVLRWSRSA